MTEEAKSNKPRMSKAQGPRRKKRTDAKPQLHHVVYVVFLRDPKGDGREGYYVGMTGLKPEQRFENHKAGIKASSVVKRCGERLVPELYEHLEAMSYAHALAMEKQLYEELKTRGYQVFGGH